MKKLTAISILLILVSAAAFAQLKVGFTADFYPDLMKATVPLEDNAKTGTTSAYNGVGTFDFFSSSNTFKGAELRLNIGYTAPNDAAKVYFEIKADDAVNGNRTKTGGLFDTFTYPPTGTTATATPGSQTKDAEQPAFTVASLLGSYFGDWYIYGNVGKLKAYVGDTANRGVVPRYHDTVFNNFFDGIKMDNYGIVTNSGGYNTYVDIFDLRRQAPPLDVSADNVANLNYAHGSRPYIALTANLDPIQVSIAGDMSTVFTGNTQSYAQGSGAIRVDGSKIADLINFSAIYRLRAGDRDTDDAKDNTAEPSGEGMTAHQFGLLGNVSLLDGGLGITLGYSGYAKAHEKTANTTYVYPYLNGIDLRFQFTGVDKLAVTFNNNVSFSVVTGDADNSTQIYGLGVGSYAGSHGFTDGTLADNSKLTSGYLGLHNALGAKFNIDDNLYATAELANTLKSVTANNDAASGSWIDTASTDRFMASLGAGYLLKIGSATQVLVESGLVFRVDSATYKVQNTTEQKQGTFTFGIPIRFKVTY